MNRFSRYLFETYGKSAKTTAKVVCNKLVYAGCLAVGRHSAGGRLRSGWHWTRYPFSLRQEVLRSLPLQAWFCPEDESSIECMLHLANYEPVDWVTPRSGEVFLDVGAYVGWYSIRASKAVGPSGRVVALEPDDVNRRQLELNLALNGLSNVTVSSLVVWSRTCHVNWQQADQPVWHRVGKENDGGAKEAVSIDDLVDRLGTQRVDWVKLDIEGAEVEVLKGATNTLKRFHPTLFIEVHETREAVLTLLGQFGYKLEREQYDQPPDRHGWILAGGS